MLHREGKELSSFLSSSSMLLMLLLLIRDEALCRALQGRFKPP
jgi:hypothetical protein